MDEKRLAELEAAIRAQFESESPWVSGASTAADAALAEMVAEVRWLRAGFVGAGVVVTTEAADAFIASQARRAERERCAKLVDDLYDSGRKVDVGARIRALPDDPPATPCTHRWVHVRYTSDVKAGDELPLVCKDCGHEVPGRAIVSSVDPK